jgi:hypothetical protein
MEILSELDPGEEGSWSSAMMGDVPYRVKIDYLAPTMDPVLASKGRNPPTVNPTLTYADAMADGKQFDILWVPAGIYSAHVICQLLSVLTKTDRAWPRLRNGGESYSRRRNYLHYTAGPKG